MMSCVQDFVYGAVSWGTTTCLCVDTGFNTVVRCHGVQPLVCVLTRGSTLLFVCGTLSQENPLVCVYVGSTICLFVCCHGDNHLLGLFICLYWRGGVSHSLCACLFMSVCCARLCFAQVVKHFACYPGTRLSITGLFFAGFCCVLFFVTGSSEQKRSARLSDLRVTTFGQYLQCFLPCIPPTVLYIAESGEKA
jgi:hypothetical protein